MSDEYRKQFMERELNEIMDALEEADDTDRVSVKALERQKRQLEERLAKLLSSKKDNSLCFEKLGFDYLVCDEAHNYKNVQRRGSADNGGAKVRGYAYENAVPQRKIRV